MTKRTNNILKSVILSWVILFGMISNHTECQTLIPDVCHQKKLSFSINQISIVSAHILSLRSMTDCRDGVCCEEQQCKEEKKILISGQYPEKLKIVWSHENKIIFTNHKAKKLFDHSCQNRIPKPNSIYIFTQSFLC